MSSWARKRLADKSAARGEARKLQAFNSSCRAPILISVAVIPAPRNYKVLCYFFLPALLSIGLRIDARYPKHISTQPQKPFRASFSWCLLTLFLHGFSNRTPTRDAPEGAAPSKSRILTKNIQHFMLYSDLHLPRSDTSSTKTTTSPALYSASH